MLSLLCALAIHGQNPAFDAGPEPLLLQHPTVNATHIVFQFADDLWSVPRSGGQAVRLTAAPGVESDPYFSPDGKWIAFSGQYDGNKDVYVMPANGGEPKRLTAHPFPDTVVGWTPDGKNVAFTSSMISNTDSPRLLTVAVTGGFPKPLPFPSGTMASFSPDGSKLAYVPNFKWEDAWKRYRGGQTYPIWIADLSDSKTKEIPRNNSNDEQPMWVGSKIFYLSDKRGPVGMYSYDLKSGTENEEIKGEGFDIKHATAGPDCIVYEKLGGIYLYNPETHDRHQVPIQVKGDFLQVRQTFKDLKPWAGPSLAGDGSNVSISPSGVRAAVAARGWVLTVPAKKGDVHLLDEAQGPHRRSPVWSPDGKTVAYLTDVKNKQQVALFELGTSKEKLLDLGDEPGFYDSLVWSPDSTKLAYTDNKHALWYIDISSGLNKKIDATVYWNPTHNVLPNWSPDSKWVTWSRDLENHLNAIFVYSLDSGKVTQITDGFANADSPIFDHDGRMLYFFASTNPGQGTSWLDLSSFNTLNIVSSVYAVVLKKDAPNPLQPESDEESGKALVPTRPGRPDAMLSVGTDADLSVQTPAPKEQTGAKNDQKKDAPKKPEAPKFGIDLTNIEDRIIALPMPPAIYNQLVAGPEGSFFALTSRTRSTPNDPGVIQSVSKFSFSDRKLSPFTQGALSFQTNADGSKALIGSPAGYSIVSTATPPPPGEGMLDLSDLKVKLDPKAEWDHMYHEVWRDERMLFYSPTMNGIDSNEMERRYQPFLKNIYSRNDLNYLFVDMLGELCVGHEFPGGGDIPEATSVPGGLLGADFTFENHRYKFERVYTGERWNPNLYAPLSQPGISAKKGEYLLEIDGKDLNDATDVYEMLEGKAGKQVRIKIGPTPDGKGSREATVVPVASEFGLRSRAWEEDNRRLVEKMTNGRGGYVHVPDTAQGGWTAFNRYYYAQVGKDGIVVDERFNHGGLINDYMVQEMKKTMVASFFPRTGKDWPTPGSTIFGPKVMIANQFSGSGGDLFPWLFRKEKIGPIIGKRTWGGLIAAFGFELADGGHINAPDDAFYDPATSKWDVENWGVSPDIEVELDPYLWRQGRDAQLERAIAELNKRLADYKAPVFKRPAYPDRTKLDVRY